MTNYQVLDLLIHGSGFIVTFLSLIVTIIVVIKEKK